jgi:GNAT superfamily N-acetyltransferase
MSDANVDKPWENLDTNVQDFTFAEWSFLEYRFGEFGEPGFSKQTIPAAAPHLFGHENSVDVNILLYRGEDGLLLCVYGSHVNDGVKKPFMLNVHPDYQKMGIASKVLDYEMDDFKSERGHDYDFNEGLLEVKSTEAGAIWARRFIERKQIEENPQ